MKHSELQEFSLTIRKASFDPKTQEMRWRADTSDVDADLYDDSMSYELYSDFLERISKNELPPESVREHYVSDFWSGGTPYLSLSHYPDLNGNAVPGSVDGVFVDGKFLKAKGRLFNTPLGRATWEALKADLEKRSEAHDPVRISIAFLDYAHRHKDTGFVFERSFDSPGGLICPECRSNAKSGKFGGKVFLKGLLIHLAMTRVPVNQRTIMEVEKAMTTRKEDAASIVGDELAAVIDEQAVSVGKADYEVTRADDDTDEEAVPAVEETPTPDEVVEDAPVVEPEVTPEPEPVLAAVNALTEEVRSLLSILRAEYGKGKDKDMDEDDDEEDDDEEQDKADLVAEPVPAAVLDTASLTVALSEAMSATNTRLDLLITALSQKAIPAGAAPERRSIAAVDVRQLQPGQSATDIAPGQPMKIGDFVRRSVNGPGQ